MLRLNVSSMTESKTISDYQSDDAEETGVISVVNAESEVEREEAGNDDIEDSAEQELFRSSVRVEMPSVSLETQEAFLRNISDNLSVRFLELAFTMTRAMVDSTRYVSVLLINQRNLFYHPPFGMMSRVQVSVQYRSYVAHVLMRVWKSGTFETLEDVIALCQMIGANSTYKLCPGIEPDEYEKEFHDVIRFHIKSVRITDFPFHRVDSINCKLLFQLALNATESERSAQEVRCSACKRLISDLNYQKKRTGSETPTRRIKRQNPSSRARLSYMSPASQAKRKKLAQYERTSNIRKLKKYEDNEVTLDDEQNDEMYNIVEQIRTEDLEKLCKEGDEHGVGRIMKDLWITDNERKRQEFNTDQAKNSKSCIIYEACK